MFTAAIGKIGVTELLLILVVVLIIFGPTQLPKLSKTLGKTISGFKKGLDEGLNKESSDKENTEPKETADNNSAE